MGAFAVHPAAFLFLLTTMSAATVDLASEATIAGVHAIRDAGILSASRANEVLA